MTKEPNMSTIKIVIAAFGIVLLAASCAASPLTPSAPTTVSGRSTEPPLFYHIFVRSFADSDGDRQGDLRGLIERLDYLQSLGVTGILMTPLYPSQFYHNYFADDFEGIDPEFGTMQDYSALIREAHTRDISVFLDQEIQYVSGQHVWYSDALNNPGSDWDGFALFADQGNTTPVGTLFGRTQFHVWPDQDQTIVTIDLLNPRVREYFRAYLMFWMDPNGDGDFTDGVDGFRIDHMMDDLDNAGVLTGLFSRFWIPIFDDLRALNPDIVIAAEQYDWGYGESFLHQAKADMVFGFPIWAAARELDASAYAEAVTRSRAVIGEGRAQFVFIENHDTNRFAGADRNRPELLKLGAALTLLTGWTPILYYGQEIGMTGDKLEGELPNPLSVSADDVRDIPLRQAFRWHGEPDLAGLANWYTAFPDLYPVGDSNRPGDGVSVAEQDDRPGSLLETYRALAALRARHPALGAGTSEVAARSDDAVVLIRRSPSQMAYVAFNFGSRRMEVSWGCSAGAFERVYGEAELRCNDARALTTLDPYEVAVWIQ